MIAGLLEMLTRRKGEAARQTATIWQQLVIAVADGTATDADEVLSSLERLGKTPVDLASAVELLTRRRAWGATASAGAQAETDHPKIVAKINSELAAFKLAEEAHEARLRPLHGLERAAQHALSEAAMARRRLVETATDPTTLAAVRESAEKLAELRREQAEHSREQRGKEDRIATLRAQDDPDLGGHVARLTREIEAMQVLDLSFATRAAEFNAESEAARQRLEAPEAI